MKIQYIFKHKNDGDMQSEVFTLDQIEEGQVLVFVNRMKKDGYILINRLFVEYIN